MDKKDILKYNIVSGFINNQTEDNWIKMLKEAIRLEAINADNTDDKKKMFEVLEILNGYLN